jgi:serine/threonine protein kinase
MQPQQVLNDRYQLQRMLGDNFNRKTWLAEDLETSELVVVKCLVLGEGRSDQWTYLKLFEREAQVLQQLDHDYIPQYRDYFPISDRTLWFALVEEYIPGHSLAELLQQGKKFTEAQVKAIAIAYLSF